MLPRVVPGLVAVLALVAWPAMSGRAFGEVPPPGSAPGTSETASSSPGSRENPPPADAEDGGGVHPLQFQPDLAIVTGVVFLLLLLILGRFAWRPIARGLEKREQRIAEEIDSAQQTNVQARQLLGEYQQKLAASGEEIRQMLENARQEAEKAGRAIVEKARDESRAAQQRHLEELERATDDTLKELAERSAGLAVELAGKIVRAQLDPNAHARLIEQAVSSFSKTTPGNN